MEFGDTFMRIDKNFTNNEVAPNSPAATIAKPVGDLLPSDLTFNIEFVDTSIIQDGDTVAVYGVKR